jgi:hypothetical protein
LNRWEDNTKMDLSEIGWSSIDWIDVAQGRGQVVGYCKCYNKHLGSIKCGKFLDWMGNSYFPKDYAL